MAAPLQVGNRFVSFNTPEDDEQKKRMAYGKAQGLDDATIAKYELIGKIQNQQKLQAQQQQVAQQAQQTQAQPKGPSGLKKFLVNAAALAAHIGTGIGSIALAPETGGASLLGGAGAGAGIDALKRKLLGEKQDVKSSLISGGLDVLPGLGEAKDAIMGAKVAGETAQAVRGADLVGQGAKAVGNASTAKSALGTVKDLFVKPAANPGIVSRTADNIGTRLRTPVVNPQVPAGIGGAAKEANIVKNVDNLVPGLTATSKYKNLQPAVSKISDQITPILDASTGTVAKKSLINDIRTAAQKSDNFIAGDATHEKALNTFLNDLTAKNAGKDLTAKDLFEYKQGLNVSSAFDKLAKGANLTPNEAAKLSIWQNLDSQITKLAPEVKPLTLQQSALIQSSGGLKKAAGKTLGVPLLGVKSKAAAGVAQGAEELVGRGLQTAGKIASIPVVNMGAKQQLAKTLLTPGTPPASTDQSQLPANPSELFPNAQQPHEVLGNAFQQAGITDPQQMFDTLTNAEQQQQAPDDSGSKLNASSTELFNQALNAPDSKTRAAYMDAAKTAAQFEQSDRAYQLAASKVGGSQLTKTQQVSVDNANNASASLDTMLQQLTEAGGAKGRVGGFIGNVEGKLGFNNKVNTYNQIRTDAAITIAQALSGSTRLPPPATLKTIEESLPNFTDNPQEAQGKVDGMKQRLAAKLKTIPGYNPDEQDQGNSFDFNTINQLLSGQINQQAY